MAFVVILFFCGLSAGTVSKLRGNTFWIWFAIGFCLPLVGTIAALLYRSEAAEPVRSCPHCGAIQPMHDQMCMNCGNELNFPEEGFALDERRPADGVAGP